MEESGHILTALSPWKEVPVNPWIGGCMEQYEKENNLSWQCFLGNLLEDRGFKLK